MAFSPIESRTLKIDSRTLNATTTSTGSYPSLDSYSEYERMLRTLFAEGSISPSEFERALSIAQQTAVFRRDEEQRLPSVALLED